MYRTPREIRKNAFSSFCSIKDTVLVRRKMEDSASCMKVIRGPKHKEKEEIELEEFLKRFINKKTEVKGTC